jgi:pimeloyl-ACP methyl ester carboxylesterase
MTRPVIALAVSAVVAYVLICALVYAFQRSLIYFPQPRQPGIAASTLTLASGSEQIAVTTRPRPGSAALIYFGGNAEDVASSLAGLAQAFPDHALYLMHYRGYGGSTGRPSEAGLFADAIALFDRVRQEHERIVVVGRSLGSGVAVHLASARPAARLVLVTPYDSLQTLAEQRFPWLPVRWLLRDRFESWRYAPRVAAPTLIVVAERDDIVPVASSETLRSRFRPGVAALVRVAGTDHNSISDSAEFGPLIGAGR